MNEIFEFLGFFSIWKMKNIVAILFQEFLGRALYGCKTSDLDGEGFYHCANISILSRDSYLNMMHNQLRTQDLMAEKFRARVPSDKDTGTKELPKKFAEESDKTCQ